MMTNANESVGDCPAPSRNVLLLFALTLGVMCTQIVLPGTGGRLALADPFIGLSFLALLLHVWRTKGAAAIPAPVPVVLVVYALANVFAQSHKPGMIEVAQRVEFLFCGVLVLGWLLKHRPAWAARAVGAALGLSVLVALVQCFRYGFGHTIPPKDVTELPLGFGKAFTGLFRSRLALGLFLGMGWVWLQPSLYAKAKAWKCWTGMAVMTAVVLGFVAHGQLLVVAAAVAILFGFIHSMKAGLANVAAVGLVALSLGIGANRSAVMADSLSPLADKYGALKPGHLEMVPAFRLANENPICGVGAGDAYQKHIGAAYKLLPRENENDMEADSQSGYGILFATVGYPAGLLLVALLLWGMGLGIRGYFVNKQPVSLGSAAALAVALGAMLVTDPFTKGNAWLVALGLAGAWGAGPVWRLDIRKLVGCCVGFAVLGGIVLAAGKAKEGGALPPPPSKTNTTAANNVWDSGAFGSSNFIRVVDAAEAVEIGKPMVKESDSQAAEGTVLHIPDKTCVPPNEKSAGLKYGGASFTVEAPEDLTCKVWVRVWWEGSCGNTLFVRLGEDGHLLRVGDDGTYKAWHWMSAPDTIQLKKGKNTVYILNREDGIRFDQMLITDDTGYYPQGIEKNEDE